MGNNGGRATSADALVLFGVTGDLVYKTMFPALYAMAKRGVFNVLVVGVAAPKWSLAQLCERAGDAIKKSGETNDRQALNHFLSLLGYVSGDYNDSGTFEALNAVPRRRACDDRDDSVFAGRTFGDGPVLGRCTQERQTVLAHEMCHSDKDLPAMVRDMRSRLGTSIIIRSRRLEIVQAPVSIKPHAAEIAHLIHAHFERAHAQCRRRYQLRMRIGRTLLVAGTAVLGIALLLRALLGDPGDRAMIVAAGEGLLILGWVAMWRPLEILLFERLENHQTSELLHRLTQIPVDFEFDAPAPGQSKRSAHS